MLISVRRGQLRKGRPADQTHGEPANLTVDLIGEPPELVVLVGVLLGVGHAARAVSRRDTESRAAGSPGGARPRGGGGPLALWPIAGVATPSGKARLEIAAAGRGAADTHTCFRAPATTADDGDERGPRGRPREWERRAGAAVPGGCISGRRDFRSNLTKLNGINWGLRLARIAGRLGFEVGLRGECVVGVGGGVVF